MRSRGFTLIELMVALAIMAIISAVAIPIYTQYSIRTYRTTAEKDLMLCAQGMERLASQTLPFSYQNLVGPGGDTGVVTTNICTPTSTNYSISVTNATPTTFTLRATATGGPVMAAGQNGALELDANGAQRFDKAGDGSFDAGDSGWPH